MSLHEAFSITKKLNNVTNEASRLFQRYNLRTSSRHISTHSSYKARIGLNKSSLPALNLDQDQLFKALSHVSSTLESTLSRQAMVQRRTLFSKASSNTSRIMAYRRLSKLEQEANSFPQDLAKQAALYKEWLKVNNPQAVIARFERGNFAQNEECWQYYIAALAQTGKADTIWSRILQKLEKGGVISEERVARELGANRVMVGDKANPVYVVVEEARKFMVWKALRWVGVTLTYAFCILTILSLALENSGLLKPTTSQNEYEPVLQSTVKFEDVQGVDEAKQELEEIVEFLKNPQRFTELGGKLPKGVLLTGPPGTGKTMLARAVAGEANVPFFFMSGSEFDEMYVGVGARRVRELFAAARAKAPSIVFIDEIDAIGSKRNPKDQSYMKQTLNQLLVDLDGFSQTEGVIFIAATNFPELLDKALVRPGRFDRLVNVPLPDVRGRIEILKHHMQNIQIASEVDISVIARGTPGFSGADLANLVNLAAIQASRDSSKEVKLRHLEHSKDKIIMGAERRSAVITDESKKLTAYHEGGHALVAYYTPGAMPLHKATIMPRGSALGMTVQLPEMDKDSFTKKEFIAQIDVCMGGRVAEELIFGDENVTSGASSDIMKATDVAKRMVRYYGMSEKVGAINYSNEDMQLLSTQNKQLIESEISNLIETSQNRVKEILTEHREELDRLANALVEYETLDAQEIKDVMTGKPITRPAVFIVGSQNVSIPFLLQMNIADLCSNSVGESLSFEKLSDITSLGESTIDECNNSELVESIQLIQKQCSNMYGCLQDLQNQYKIKNQEEQRITIEDLCKLAKDVCDALQETEKSARGSKKRAVSLVREEENSYNNKVKHEPIKRSKASSQSYKYYRKNKLGELGHTCHSCGTTETPEWRRGPDGARTLCNACGLHYSKLLRKGALGAQTESCILSGSTGESQSLVGVTKESIFPENYPFVLMNPKYGFNTTIDEVSVTASQKQFKTIDTLKIPTCDDNIKENNTPPLRIYQWKK